MWRDAAGGIELGCTGTDPQADVQVANGAGMVSRITTLQGVVEGEPQEKEGSVSMTDNIEDVIEALEDLQQRLGQACEEQTEWDEEIDRQNLRQLLDDIDRVERVKMLMREIV